MRESGSKYQESPLLPAKSSGIEDNGPKTDAAGESEDREHVAGEMKDHLIEAAFRIGRALQAPTREVRAGLLALISQRLIQDSRARKAIAGFIAGLALSYGIDQHRNGEEIAHAASSQEAATLEQFRQNNPELGPLLLELEAQLPMLRRQGNDLQEEQVQEEKIAALWERLLEAERGERFSFFKGEWKGLDLDTKARIMLRFVESDLDKEKNSYKYTPFILLDEYLSHPLAKEILLKAVVKEPEDAFRKFKEYRREPWAMEVLEKAIQHGTALQGRRSLPDLIRDGLLSEDERARLEQVITQEHPDPSVSELWQKFSEEPGEMKTDFFVNVWQGLGVQAKGDFMQKLLHSRWEFAAGQAFLYFPEYKSHPEAKTILSQAMRGKPRMAIEGFDVYKDQPWAQEVLQEALPLDRDSAIQHFKAYSHFPWAEEALKKFLAVEPYYAIEYFKVYDTFPWAESVLKTWLKDALKKAPGLAIKSHSSYKQFPWAQQLLRNAIANDADASLRYFPTYKEYPWADEAFLVQQAKRASYQAVRNFLQSSAGKSLPEEERSRIEASVSELAKVADTLLKRNEQSSFPRFREDPAVQHVGEVDPSWIPDEHVHKTDAPALAQYRALIARNLYFQGIETITKETVQKESERIILMRERYRNVPLFKGRNIVVAAHVELTPENFRNPADPWRFGKAALISELERQQSAGGKDNDNSSNLFVRRERPKAESMEEVSRVKQETLNLIKTLPNPLTFIFDGHGGPDGLYFSAGLPDAGGGVSQTQAWRGISPQELADALVARYASSPKPLNHGRHEDTTSSVILVFDDCYSSTYLRKLYDILAEHKVPKPIVIGASEYGQLGYSDFHSPFGSNFMENTILQKDTGGGATIGGVVDHDAKQKDSNPSLYIPDEANRPMQLSKEQEAERNDTPAA